MAIHMEAMVIAMVDMVIVMVPHKKSLPRRNEKSIGNDYIKNGMMMTKKKLVEMYGGKPF